MWMCNECVTFRPLYQNLHGYKRLKRINSDYGRLNIAQSRQKNAASLIHTLTSEVMKVFFPVTYSYTEQTCLLLRSLKERVPIPGFIGYGRTDCPSILGAGINTYLFIILKEWCTCGFLLFYHVCWYMKSITANQHLRKTPGMLE